MSIQTQPWRTGLIGAFVLLLVSSPAEDEDGFYDSDTPRGEQTKEFFVLGETPFSLQVVSSSVLTATFLGASSEILTLLKQQDVTGTQYHLIESTFDQVSATRLETNLERFARDLSGINLDASKHAAYLRDAVGSAIRFHRIRDAILKRQGFNQPAFADELKHSIEQLPAQSILGVSEQVATPGLWPVEAILDMSDSDFEAVVDEEIEVAVNDRLAADRAAVAENNTIFGDWKGEDEEVTFGGAVAGGKTLSLSEFDGETSSFVLLAKDLTFGPEGASMPFHSKSGTLRGEVIQVSSYTQAVDLAVENRVRYVFQFSGAITLECDTPTVQQFAPERSLDEIEPAIGENAGTQLSLSDYMEPVNTRVSGAPYISPRAG